jgi:hypothetical protein
LRKAPGETRKNGSLVKNQGRFGPIKLEKRLEILEQLLGIQQRVNTAGIALGRPQVSLINSAEELFIRAAIGSGVWPDRWDGTEPDSEEWFPTLYEDGTLQPLLWDPIAL